MQEQNSKEEELFEDFSEEAEAEEDILSAEDDIVLPLEAQIGSILFVSIKPVSAQVMAEATKATVEEVEEALAKLKDFFKAEIHGFSLEEISGSWQLRTANAAKKVINRMIPPKARRLTKAAAESLAIIAYKQPVQRAEVEAIRGVDALPTLRTLLDAKLIRIVGRDSSPGQPALYGTTNTFLEKFGMKDLSELPSIRELVEISSDPGESEIASHEEL